MQRRLWLRDMRRPVLLHGAYITDRRIVHPGGIQKEIHYLDEQAPLISSYGRTSYRDTGLEQMERIGTDGKTAPSSTPRFILETAHSTHARKYQYFPLY